MQDGGKLPPGIRRAMAQRRGTVAPIPGIKKPAEFIGGYVGADPRYGVMDPDADALERAYRAGEATSVIGDIVGSISPFATASTLARANALPGAAVVEGGAALNAFRDKLLAQHQRSLAKDPRFKQAPGEVTNLAGKSYAQWAAEQQYKHDLEDVLARLSGVPEKKMSIQSKT